MEITFRGQVDEDTAARSLRAHLRSRLRLSSASTLLLALFVLGAVTNGVLALDAGKPLRPYLLALLPFAVIFATGFVVTRRRFQKSFNADHAAEALLQGTASETGIRLRSEHGSSEVPWDAFGERVISRSLVLLYCRPSVPAYILPRELFGSAADWKSFQGLVKENVGDGASLGTRVFVLVLLVVVLTVIAVVLPSVVP